MDGAAARFAMRGQENLCHIGAALGGHVGNGWDAAPNQDSNFPRFPFHAAQFKFLHNAMTDFV
jgi:hypothetical protein